MSACGRSAVGSAPPCQGGCRGFESRRPLESLCVILAKTTPRCDGREARHRTANPATRVQIPFAPLIFEIIVTSRNSHSMNGYVMTLETSERPWGRYEVLQESETFKVKCIWVLPGKRFSYQRHEKRAEHWYIVQGTADVTLNGVTTRHLPGDSVMVEVGDLHRLSNVGIDDVIFIEVQTGTYFGEDDIERLEDDFGR